MPDSVDNSRSRVFISYARLDESFANQLVSQLKDIGFNAYLDKHDIAPGEPWKQRLRQLITASDSVVFCVSPDSVVSEMCDWEVNEAERQSKRIFPVVCRDVSDDSVPGRLRRLNYVYIRATDNNDVALTELAEALRTDLEWIRQHTVLAEQAIRWQNSNQDASLLRGEQLAEAEYWLSSHPVGAPAPTGMQRNFIRRSKEVELEILDKQRRQQERTRRLQRRAGRALFVIGALVLAGLITAFWQSRAAFMATSRLFAGLGVEALESGNYDRAAKYSLAGLPRKGALPLLAPWSPRLEAILAGALQRNRLRTIVALPNSPVVTSAMFTRDNTTIVSGSYDGMIRVSEPDSGKILKEIQAHDMEIFSLSLDPTGKFLSTSSRDNSTRIWNLDTGDYVTAFRSMGWSRKAAWSSDGTLIAVAADAGPARIWSLESKEAIAVLPGDLSPIYELEFDSAGENLAIASFDGTVRIWNLEKQAEIGQLDFADTTVSDISFDRGSTKVATAHSDGTIRLWNAKTLQQTHLLEGHTEYASSVEFSHDGQWLVSASYDNTVRIWNGSSGQVVDVLVGHDDKVTQASISPDDGSIVTASHDGTVRIWRAHVPGMVSRLGKASIGFRGLEATIDASVSKSNNEILILSHDNKARVHDLESGKEIIALPDSGQGLADAKYSVDGTRIVATTMDGVIRVWDRMSGDEVLSVGSGGTDGVDGEISGDGSRLLAFGAGPATLWDVETNRKITELDEIEIDVIRPTFSPDGSRLLIPLTYDSVRLLDADSGETIATLSASSNLRASFSTDSQKVVSLIEGGPAIVWDARSGDEVVTLVHENGAYSASISPDGKHVLTSTDKNALLWNSGTGNRELILAGHSGRVLNARFSPDGKTIVTEEATEQGTDWRFGLLQRNAFLWNAETGDLVAALDGHPSGISSLSYSGDSQRIVTIGTIVVADKTARVWDTLTGTQVAVLNVDTESTIFAGEFSTDNARIAIATDAEILLYDVRLAAGIRERGLITEACKNQLSNSKARSFSAVDLNHPVFEGQGLLYPCDRHGSWD